MRRPPLSEDLLAEAQAYEAGEQTPAEPRDAATVVLLRPSEQSGADQSGASEVYLMRRQASMEFAGGMHVFPGGGVDPRDYDLGDEHWYGDSAAQWAERLGCPVPKARALVCAAVRETFEESGVLLAGPLVDDTTGEDWEADRAALEARTLSMSAFLTRRGLVLRTDLLGAWSGWLTPAYKPRRYRTWFFVAVLPQGQATRDVSSESATVAWRSAAAVVDEVDAGECAMMPPTYLTCLEIAALGAPDQVLAAAASRTVEMFMPSVSQAPDGTYVLSTPPAYERLLEGRP